MSESASESRTETALPARGLSGLQAAEQWQETSAWNFSLPAGMRALIQSLVAPRRPAVNREGGRPGYTSSSLTRREIARPQHPLYLFQFGGTLNDF